MKRLLTIALVLTALILSSCSLASYQCPAYSSHNKSTKHGTKAQVKYARRN